MGEYAGEEQHLTSACVLQIDYLEHGICILTLCTTQMSWLIERIQYKLYAISFTVQD